MSQVNPEVKVYADLLEMCRAETLLTAGNVPVPNRMHQLRKGKATPLWLIGHVANTVNVVLLQWTLELDGVLPAGYVKKFAPDFAGGDPVGANPEDYPAWDEVLHGYDAVMRHGIEAVRANLTDADLSAPPRGAIPDMLRPRFPSIGVVLGRMIGHDSYHRGQVGLLSKLEIHG